MGYLEQLEVALFGWQMKTLDKKKWPILIFVEYERKNPKS